MGSDNSIKKEFFCEIKHNNCMFWCGCTAGQGRIEGFFSVKSRRSVFRVDTNRLATPMHRILSLRNR